MPMLMGSRVTKSTAWSLFGGILFRRLPLILTSALVPYLPTCQSDKPSGVFFGQLIYSDSTVLVRHLKSHLCLCEDPRKPRRQARTRLDSSFRFSRKWDMACPAEWHHQLCRSPGVPVVLGAVCPIPVLSACFSRQNTHARKTRALRSIRSGDDGEILVPMRPETVSDVSVSRKVSIRAPSHHTDFGSAVAQRSYIIDHASHQMTETL